MTAAAERGFHERADDRGGLVGRGCPRAQLSTLRSLCSRATRAVSTSAMAAARTPGSLLAAIAIPMPVPHTRTPRSNRPSLTPRATAEAKSG
jgi:hypothetical protein